ncbi:MAG: hypothetical protein GY834_17230 [Bacteroidetes bacterium]|nr:hypothetical protein [Bacteroidota bacterium]
MKKTIYILGLALIGVMFITGCEYEFIARPLVIIDPVDPDDPVDPNLISFAGEIIPIFTTGNRCTSCHGTGGQAPVLTTTLAYSQIISQGLVNTADPSSSKLYTYPKIGAGTHVWKTYSTDQAAEILQWITEGAKNN